MSAPVGGPVRIGNRYRIEERVGVGAMGAVWRATDELLGRTVAVKELLAVDPGAGAAEIEESRQRILREGRIGARLQHPHVISMLDVVVHEDRPWLVMEYLPSQSLAARVTEQGQLSPPEVADIGWQVADGLAAAHFAGVVHRDVKPGNVLIATDGLVKLTDFGVSRAVDDVQLTRTGLIAGTPAFLAPEVAQGRDPTEASDVFALGATLYAAVEGTPPFGLDDNAFALLHKVATGEPDPPRQAGALGQVLMRLLSVDPAARPSAAQARELLAAVAAGRADAAAPSPAGAGPPTRAGLAPPGIADAPARRRRAPVLLGLLLGLLVLGGGAAALALSNGSGGSVAAPPTTAVVTPAPSRAAPPSSASAARTTRPAPSPTPSSAPALTAAPGPGSTDPVDFVQRYYALLPGNTDAAFALLGPRARSQSGGADGFASFYARMQSVTVQNPRRAGDNAVTGTVRFVEKNGTTSDEPYRFVITTDGSGRTIMESFSRG